MEKRRKFPKFLKNRNWKSKVANRLKGRADEICQDFYLGKIDHEHPVHFHKDTKKWLHDFIHQRRSI